MSFCLQYRELRVFDQTGVELARTPDEWLVQWAGVADVDADKRLELLLLVWKRGSFGTKRPFWHSGDDRAWTQHVFVLRVPDEPGEFERVWMSSDLGNEVTAAAIDDEARLLLTDSKGRTTVWVWNTWGFTLT